MSETRFQILVCRGPTCGEKRNSRAVYDAVCALVSSYGLQDRIDIDWQSCFGRCTRGPNALVRERRDVGKPPLGLASLPLSRGGRAAMYCGLAPADADDLIHEHVLRGAIVERLVDRSPGEAPGRSPERSPPEPGPARDDAPAARDSTEKAE